MGGYLEEDHFRWGFWRYLNSFDNFARLFCEGIVYDPCSGRYLPLKEALPGVNARLGPYGKDLGEIIYAVITKSREDHISEVTIRLGKMPPLHQYFGRFEKILGVLSSERKKAMLEAWKWQRRAYDHRVRIQ